MTLPLIYALQNTTHSKKRHIISLIKRHSENKEKVREVIEFVNQSGGLQYATDVMYRYRAEAFELLHEFPESIARKSLEDLVIFVTDRKK